MSKQQPSIMFIAGEASGDSHAAYLIKEILAEKPNIHCFGIGGDEMQKAGADIHFNLAKYGEFGIREILKNICMFYRVFKWVKQTLKEQKPDLLVLVDNAGFNLRVAKVAKRLGISVFYFISPQVWASRAGRIKTIRENVDHIAVILPFEKALYEKHDVPVSYVGHPLLSTVVTSMDEQTARAHFGLKSDSRVIGLMPGSRPSEIKRLMPIIYDSAKRLLTDYPDLEFILPVASSLSVAKIQEHLPANDLPIHYIHDHRYDALSLCHSVITSSGTATLELSLLGKPMVIIYQVSALTYHVGKYLVKISSMGLCNLLSDTPFIPELFQEQVNADNIVHEIKRYFDDEVYYSATQAKLLTIKHNLDRPEDQRSTSELILDRVAS